MNFLRSLTIILLGSILFAACGSVTTPAPTALPPIPIPNTPAPTQVPALTEQSLQNGTYALPVYSKTVTLSDGKYEGGSGADYLAAVLQPEIAFGDVNGDGAEDAAVLIGENGGGSGVFVSLFVILNQNGQPFQAGTALVDDRPIINSLAIQDGKIVLDAVIHQAEDSMVSPTFAVLETYQLTQGGLTLMQLNSKTDTGLERSITIDSPSPNMEVSSSTEITGSMPVGPFENTLRLRVYDTAGNVLLENPFNVQSDGAGGAAAFDNPVDLSSIPTGTTVRLELADISAKDGSVISMDSVMILRK
jgi:hypothetical protein